jgi:hypothetical protein
VAGGLLSVFVNDPIRHDISSRLDRLESLQEISQLVHRYAIAADSRDVESIVAMFIDDFDTRSHGVGRDALRAFYRDLHAGFYRSIHQIGGHTIELIDSDHATGKLVMRAEHEVGDRWVLILMCLFEKYERRDGHWLFVSRRPETWYTCDVGDRPLGGDGQMGLPAVGRLPQRFATWAQFWEGREDLAARLSHRP